MRVSFADNHCSPSFFKLQPLVAMVAAADLRNRHNSSEFGRLHYPRFRRVLRQGEMGAGVVIIFCKRFSPVGTARQASRSQNN
jgi:hypothetical protein